MKLKYLIPFLFLFNINTAQSQFKAEINTREIDFKSEYFDVSARDTFGLDNFVNARGRIKAKYGKNSFHAVRNGLLNHHYGGNLNLEWLNLYHNRSNQNTRTENHKTQESPIGRIITETTILNDDKMWESGLTISHNDLFFSFENAVKNNKTNGQTLIRINNEADLINFSFNFRNETNIHGIGFKYGFLKYIQNKQDNNEFGNYLIGANHSGLNIYYGKELAGFFNISLFKNVDVNLSYDRKLKINFSTNDFSRLNHNDFERNLENKLRIVPRIYDSPLETARDYISDMFFTDLYSFSIDKNNIAANINLGNILFHYSNENLRTGLKYKFAIAAYDFKQKEARIGVFLD